MNWLITNERIKEEHPGLLREGRTVYRCGCDNYGL